MRVGTLTEPGPLGLVVSSDEVENVDDLEEYDGRLQS